MAPGGLPAAVILLLAIGCALQALAAEDIYWEGEDDAKNEYLEVKEDDGITGALRRVRRDFFDIFRFNSEPQKEDVDKNDEHIDEDNTTDRDDEELDSNFGSGAVPEKEPELREKTLRVSFVVMEPYQLQYSNRDSEQFQNLSKSLADAVNKLFEQLPGTQRASLVRIQSRSSDSFSCKVTLDISTIGFDDLTRITNLLRSHIQEKMNLGVIVKDTDFSATAIDPDLVLPECASDEFHCSDGHCVLESNRCNGHDDCSDGSDELDCDNDTENILTTTQLPSTTSEPELSIPNYVNPDNSANPESDNEVETATDEPSPGDCSEPINCEGSFKTYCPEHKCDGVRDCPGGEDEQYCDSNTQVPRTTECEEDMFRCDETRCIPKSSRCDFYRDCYDGKDEENCGNTESCGDDDFRCDNGKCISSDKRCNQVIDCSNREDEINCDCSENQFRCSSDGSCIEKRKVCDSVPDCSDGSDEVSCTTCSLNQWQCDHGSCIKRTKRCDGRVDCPTDRSDERNCLASGYFRCRSGTFIPERLRCNHKYDCPPGDFSDEKNCPCGEGDYKCDNGYCIPSSKHCDRTNDCQDGSDERNCIYERICMASEYKCSNGQCVQADGRCNGLKECTDGSDEMNCPCKRDEFHCRDGSCINIALRCDGNINCRPHGEDEIACGAPVCSGNTLQCRNGNCGEKCNGIADCDDGEDEEGCDNDACQHSCDGRCIEDKYICDGNPDCRDGSDELNCYLSCDGPNDFRCSNGDCINDVLRCNKLQDCSDGSDEEDCENKVPTVDNGCNENQYQCRNGNCIDNQFLCDHHYDCEDNSDEENCLSFALRPYRSPLESRAVAEECHESQFTCYDGRCIPHLRRCDNIYDCLDFSDEQNCQNSAPTANECSDEDYQCASGQCIPANDYCNGVQDCNDNSDESSCVYPTTTNRPVVQTSYPPYRTTTSRPYYYTTTGIPLIQPDGCNRNEWRCENGPCISRTRRCDGLIDCPYDDSDELDCPEDSSAALKLKTYPAEQTVRYGGDVVFQCRDEGPMRAPVRWIREGGRPLKPGATDRNGRLELFQVTPSDSGTYICQAPRHLENPGSNVRVILRVDPKAPNLNQREFLTCKSYEATCGSGQCIPKTAVCDGKFDCNDESDESECNQNGHCEPNQYQCANRRCIMKNWLCDAEDDCGDNSDEQECGTIIPGQTCLPTEFTCHAGDQCVPKSFHCDGHNDCFDKSDELGCVKVSIRKQPYPSNVRLQPGETLTLSCEAVGIPTPLISWRLNWGHIPSKCRTTSIDGIGTLICPNIQPIDSGAYSCEAFNNKGTAFAAPDSIVFVNRTSVCPDGYFNREANSPSECVRCFCFGESTQCQSADLFTYNMPTPLGEGGTNLLGVQPSYSGDITIDSQPITDLFYYQPLRNGAMVTKLDTYASRRSHPYITLPETYNGNQLTSYGGYIKYRLQPHSQRISYDNNVPHIIIKGKYETLLHYHQQRNERVIMINARLVPENWQKASPGGLVPATREDIMMALDNVESIMLRSDLNGAGANITDFIMESAQHIDVGLGASTLVEECQCPDGYEGLSCQKCASGYGRRKSGPWLGNCMREEAPCPPGTYGDPNNGLGCQKCPCPLTNRENQFASTCSLGSNGRVVCDCMSGYEGPNCERCAPGYVGNPTIPGDSCQVQPRDNCNPLGTVRVRLPDECECKENVQGRYCDQCNDYSFYLSEDNRHGCAQCFCTGVTQQCSSSDLRRKTSTVVFNVPALVDQVKVYNSTPVGAAGAIRYMAPVETDLTPVFSRGEISLGSFDRSRPTIYYWSLPVSFAGDKVTSYGGFLHYTLRHVPAPGGQFSRNNAADVQLISDNRLIFHYFGNFAPSSDGYLNASVQFLEKGWQRSDGKEVQRESLLLALADVKTILIKATYSTNTRLSSIVSASIDTADPYGDGPQALHVEQCVCPPGYLGTSCEDCAPGYTRSPGGLYLGLCTTCECNGRSDMCDPETGTCYNCADNTAGDNCELCRPGYQRDRYNMCVRTDEPSGGRCNCDSRGEERPCEDGRCICKQNVEGDSCDRCRPGSFALSENHPDGCIPCYCSGVTSECNEGTRYTRVPLPAPIFGENYGGYTLMNLNADSVINSQFVPATNESELMYVFSYPPNEDLYWSLPEFPGNRVLSYGGKLSLTQRFNSGGYAEEFDRGFDVVLVGDQLTLFWTNPQTLREGQTLTYKVPLTEDNWYLFNTNRPASRNDFMSVLRNLKRILVKAAPSQSSTIQSTSIADVSMDTAADNFNGPPVRGIEVCMCPEGYTGTSCESCSSGYYKDQRGNCRACNCNGHHCQLATNGEIICNCRPPYTGRDCSSVAGEPNTSNYTTRAPPPQSTVVVRITSPTIKTQEIGDSVNFTCKAQSRFSQSPIIVKWRKADGNLPQDRIYIDERDGLLLITNLQASDSGRYICQAQDGITVEEASATLQVPSNKMTLPSVTINPTNNEYYEGDRIQLECLATGIPTPRITWQRVNNRALPVFAETFETFYVIDRAVEEDSGEYRCIATNQAGSTDRTAIISVRPRSSRPGRDKLATSVSSVNIAEGQSTRVVCTGSANIPSGTIGWVRQDGSELLVNVQSNNGVLYIEEARPENIGVYVCQSTSSNIVPVNVVVTVVPRGTPPPSEVPNVTVNEERIKIPTGGSAVVRCEPSGYPLPLIKWKKHQSEMGPGVSQRDNSLVINNAQEDDQGYYLCEGSVSNTPVANVYVFVEIERREPPNVEIWPPGEQAVPLGSDFELHCQIKAGIPEPYIMWSRADGRPLAPHVQILPQNVLRFEKVEVNDEGEYSCSARNEAGTQTASSVLKVRSPPEIVISPTNYIYVVNGDPINLECRASGYPEPLVSIRKVLPDVREVIPQTPGMAALRVARASYHDDGSYTCIATSEAGTFEESFLVSVDRGDGGFDGSGGGEPEYEPEQGRPENIIAFEGQDSKLTCDTSDDSQVEWSRENGQRIQNNARQIGRQLIISGTSRADAGYYECTVKDRNTGEASHIAFIEVQVKRPPSITLRPQRQSVVRGQQVTVNCDVDGDDIIDVTWRPVNTPFSRRVQVDGPTLILNDIQIEDAGEYECIARSTFSNASDIAHVIVNGTQTSALVEIEHPRGPFRVGENVKVLCRTRARDNKISWNRLGTNQFVKTTTYGDGSMLLIDGVQESDAGQYQCTGRDLYGRQSFESFNLEVTPDGSSGFSYPDNDRDEVYSAKLLSTVDLPCKHNLDEPVSIEWRKDFVPISPEVNTNERILHLDRITESDAGTYICRVSNSRAAVEARAILRVLGVVPSFNGHSWLSLPTLKDAYSEFDIEISLKPTGDMDGLIFYNSENEGREGDFIALLLNDGVPQFVIETGFGPFTVKGDQPLQLNTWHTIRINWILNKVTMDVDNRGPFIMELGGSSSVLDLKQPFYLGGVPDYEQLPAALAGVSPFIGCVSMLVLRPDEVNIMLDSLDRSNVNECDSCSPSPCYNDGVCQGARNEKGYICLCPAGFAGQDCSRPGEACRPGLCGPGKCSDTAEGYSCACPVTYSGKRCEVQRSIEYPAFTGNAFIAVATPRSSRFFKVLMKVKASSYPIHDGIIMYCAQSPKGYGGFTSLAVRNGRLEFRYDLGDGSGPVVLTSNMPLQVNEWASVQLSRVAQLVSMKINTDTFNGTVSSARKELVLDTPLYIGGYDDSIVLNNNTGVTGGFSGCIKDVSAYGKNIDIVGNSIKSANIQECGDYRDRGDIPENEIKEITCYSSRCRNGGFCRSSDAYSCSCQPGFTGHYCENRAPSTPRDPCRQNPCVNGGTCRRDQSKKMNYYCDCPLGFAGTNCQMRLDLRQTVGFNGNGYLELPSRLLQYDNLVNDPAIIALSVQATADGVLLYQRDQRARPGEGSFILLRIESGRVILEWDFGGGVNTLAVDEVMVTDGNGHKIIATLSENQVPHLSVDDYHKTGASALYSSVLSPDSNIYIGGIPDSLNVNRYPGLSGCFDHVELMSMGRNLNLGEVAVAARNTQRCRDQYLRPREERN